MTTLVLGGCGFIGSHLVEDLVADGRDVRVLDRSMGRHGAQIEGVDYRIADFEDTAALAEAMAGVDLVYHLISTTVPSTSNLDPVADVRGNLVNTLGLLRLAVNGRKPRIIFLSSGGTVYGVPSSLPVAEHHPIAPICSHGIVKAAIENYLGMYGYLEKLPYTILRVSNPYGERQGHFGVQGVIGTFVQKILRQDPVEVWGDGTVVRDFLHVDDLVELCRRAGDRNIDGIFNAGSGVGHSIIDVIEVLKSVTGCDIDVTFNETRAFDVPRIWLSIDKVRESFDWRPRIELATGIERVWRAVASDGAKGA